MLKDPRVAYDADIVGGDHLARLARWDDAIDHGLDPEAEFSGLLMLRSHAELLGPARRHLLLASTLPYARKVDTREQAR